MIVFSARVLERRLSRQGLDDFGFFFLSRPLTANSVSNYRMDVRKSNGDSNSCALLVGASASSSPELINDGEP